MLKTKRNRAVARSLVPCTAIVEIARRLRRSFGVCFLPLPTTQEWGEDRGENSPKPDSRLETLNRKGEKPKDLGRTKMFFPSFPHLCPSQIFGGSWGGGG